MLLRHCSFLYFLKKIAILFSGSTLVNGKQEEGQRYGAVEYDCYKN